MGERLDRTQEVAGSSPASSITRSGPNLEAAPLAVVVRFMDQLPVPLALLKQVTDANRMPCRPARKDDRNRGEAHQLEWRENAHHKPEEIERQVTRQPVQGAVLIRLVALIS